MTQDKHALSMSGLSVKNIKNHGWITIYPDKHEIDRLKAVNSELLQALEALISHDSEKFISQEQMEDDLKNAREVASKARGEL